MKANWIKEVWLATVQSLKLLLRGKQTLILLLGGMAVLVAMLLCMDDAKEEKSRIRIGIVNEDDSSLSEKIVREMKQLDLYEVAEGSLEELLEQVKEGELAAVCVLKEGFSDSVEKGKTNKLVTLHESENGSALLLGDILAGVMMQEICTAKAYQELVKYDKKTGREVSLSAAEYQEYVARLMEEEGAEFSFEVTYVSPDREVMEKPSQSLIYEQAIFAVFALMAGLLSVYAVLPFRRLRHGRLAGKVKTLPLSGGAIYFGSALGAFFVPACFGICFLGCYHMRNEVELSKFISLLVCTMVYICVIVCLMLLAAYGIKSQTVYQMGMLAMILIFGVFGLVSLVDGLLLPEGTVTWVPNGWYVRKMTEILNQM